MRRCNKLLKSGTSLMLVLAMLLGMCGTAFAAPLEENEEAEGGVAYVSLGDSVANGYGLDVDEQSYPELFAQQLGAAHENHAYDAMRVEDLRYALQYPNGTADPYTEAFFAELGADVIANLQDAVANADVISLGIGNANFGDFAVNRVLSALGMEIPGVETDWIDLELALADCDETVRAFVLELYDGLKEMLEEQMTDGDKIAEVLDVLTYTVVSYMTNYVGVLGDIAEVNQKEDLKVMLVGLVNVLDDMKVETGSGVVNVGRLMNWAVKAVNAYLVTVPAVMQMSGQYEDVTFIYAADTDVELMYTKLDDLNEVSRGKMIDHVCATVFPMLGAGFDITVEVSASDFTGNLGDLSSLPGMENIGETIGMTVTVIPETVTYDEVVQYEAYAAGLSSTLNMGANKMYSCALYLAFEQAIIQAKDLKVVSLDTFTALTGGLNSVFGKMIATLKADVKGQVNDELIEAAVETYKAWALTEGAAFAKEMMDQMISDTIKDYEAEYNGEMYTIPGLYVMLLNTVAAQAGLLVPGLELGTYDESDVLWDELFASLIADYENDAAQEAAARAVFEAHIKQDLIDAAIVLATAEAEKMARELAEAEIDKMVRAEAEKMAREAVEAEIAARVRESMPGMPEAMIEAAIAAAIAAAAEEIDAAVKAALEAQESMIQAAVKAAIEQAEPMIQAEIAKQLEENRDLIIAEAENQVNSRMDLLWRMVWTELKQMYVEVKKVYEENKATLEKIEENAWLLPLSLLLQDLDETDPMKPYQQIVSDIVLTPIADKTATVVTESLVKGLTTDETLYTLMYLFGRTLAANGLGYHPSAAGHVEICNAMVAKYESGQTVHDDLRDLIALLNKYGPKVLTNTKVYDKLNDALDKLRDKLEGRVDDKVLSIIDKAKSAVNKVNDVINGNKELDSKKVISALKNALANLDQYIAELFELVGRDVPPEVQAAMDEFKAAYERATSGEFDRYGNSYYVAIGDKLIAGEGSYADLLAAELEMENLYTKLSSGSIEESILALNDAQNSEHIARADLITVGFSNNSMFDFMAAQLREELSPSGTPEKLDWVALVGEEGAKYIQDALGYISESLIKEGMSGTVNVVGVNLDILELLMLAIESYAYAAVSYTVSYPVLIEKIRQINPYGTIIAVGMSNTAANIDLDMSGLGLNVEDTFDMGNYVEYLVEIANIEALAYAMMGENIIFVEAPDVDIIAEDTDYTQIGTFILEALTGDFSDLYASDEGHEYIKTQILDALEITEHGLLGDVNFDGVVNGSDANLFYRYVSGEYVFSEKQLVVGDVNYDGEVNGTDTNMVYRYVSGALPYLGAPEE